MRPVFCLSIIFLLLSQPCFAQGPLVFGQPDDPVAELSARVLEEAYTRINIKVRFEKLPAERSLLNSNAGQLDGEVNRVAGIEKKYPNLIRVSSSVNHIEAMVFTKKYDFTVFGWNTLMPYTIAIRIGTKFAEKRTEGMKVGKFPTYDKVFKLVSANRYDVCVVARITGLCQIKKDNLAGIKALEPPLEKFDLYHYLHKKHADLVPIIGRELETMHQENRMAEIRKAFITQLLPSDMTTETANTKDANLVP